MIGSADGRKIISTPVSDQDISGLRVGEVIYITGSIVACRDSAHKRVVDDGIGFPADLRGGVLFHAGPIARQAEDGRYEIVSVGPTTSMRMEDCEYAFIRETGAKIIIGKGGMKDDTARACAEFGAIHCAAPAGCAVVGAVCVEEVTAVEWLDLGMPEAVWCMRVKEFGPLVVTIDTKGNNYFEEKKKEYTERKDEQIRRAQERLAE